MLALSSMTRKKTLQGIIKRHPDGFGFFIPDNFDHPDVYIPQHSMQSAMSNDRVEIDVFPDRGRDRFRGEILQILERATKKIVGKVSSYNENLYKIPDDSKAWGTPLFVPKDPAFQIKEGDLVAAEVVHYPGSQNGFLGKIIEVLGAAEDPLNDIRRVIYSQNIPQDFSKDCLKQASGFSENPTEADIQGRKDLRDKCLITIDGATAKDFDDAVCVEMTDRGYHVLVAIADVSHYVRQGSAIDQDAYVRGTSVYFPNFVVPMIPEQLSNGLCSLNPHVPRLCLVADMHMDFEGNTLSSQFYEAVMESRARVTYGQAQEVIDGENVPGLDQDVCNNIRLCADLAKVLLAKRFREGSLELEIPDTQLEIDAGGNPVDIVKSERLFSHRLIEELMLAANVAVARFLSNRKIPALYRIHEEPDEQSIRLLERYLWNFGSKMKLRGQDSLQKKLTRALEEFKGKPESQILNILTLRSMSQAKYHPDNVGHFGLGFSDYTHFTSPIRRYPDLIVHRLVKSAVMKNSPYKTLPEDYLFSAGTMLSACEQRAAKAERQIQSIKKARFVQKLIGQSFTGIISSVTKFGIFVLLREYDVDGLIRMDNLGDDHFQFEEAHMRLMGRRTRKVYALGDLVDVTVAGVDISLGQIDFVLQGTQKYVRPAERQNEKQNRRSQSQKIQSKPDKKQEGLHFVSRTKDRNQKSSNAEEPPASKKNQSSEMVPVFSMNDILRNLKNAEKSRDPDAYAKKSEGPSHPFQRFLKSKPERATNKPRLKNRARPEVPSDLENESDLPAAKPKRTRNADAPLTKSNSARKQKGQQNSVRNNKKTTNSKRPPKSKRR
jgi:ribonuclease R